MTQSWQLLALLSAALTALFAKIVAAMSIRIDKSYPSVRLG